MPYSSGDRLGPYEITALIGAGGMGEVYRACDTRLDRTVAVKVSKAQFSERFEREARAVAALNHPNICQLYDVGPDYLVMEFIEGVTPKGPLPIEKAMTYAGQILDALDAAHKKGIIHRDLKPDNILVTRQGLKLLDFGLAKYTAPAAELDSSLTQAMTGQGQIAGTLQYMSPEQLHGKDGDARSDLFAFGCVLYELISGKRAFSGESAASVIAAILEREPAALNMAPQFERVIKTCLAKDPDQRFQNALDLKRALAWAAEQTPLAVTRQRTMLPSLLFAAAAIAVISAIVWLPSWRTQGAEKDRPLIQLDLDAGAEVFFPVIAPDGRKVVFSANGQLAVRSLDKDKTTPLAGTQGGTYPFFSPDGQWVAFFTGGKLQKISLEGGAPSTICDAPVGRGGSWGEDGYIIVALDRLGGLSRVPAAGGTPQPFTNLKGEKKEITSHRKPHVLPGGKGVLFETSDGGGLYSSVRALPSGGGAARLLVENASNGRYLASGHLLYYQSGTLFTVPLDLNRLELTGPATSLVEGVRWESFDVSSSGTLVYVRGTPGLNHSIAWMDSSGKVQPLSPKSGHYLTPRLSPDGKRLAVGIRQQNLFIYDFIRETMTPLNFDVESHGNPVWTPDGEFLAFQSGERVAWGHSDGSGKAGLSAESFGASSPTSFSSDGKWLVFSHRDPQTASDVWVAAVERTPGALQITQPHPLVQEPANQVGAVISPDGRWLAYASDEAGRLRVYVIPFSPRGPPAGGRWQVSTDVGSGQVWSRNGPELLYRGPNQQIMTTAYTAKGDSFKAEKPRVWAQQRIANSGPIANFDVAADGRVLGLFDADDAKPETMMRVVLNVSDELRRRIAAKAVK